MHLTHLYNLIEMCIDKSLAAFAEIENFYQIINLKQNQKVSKHFMLSNRIGELWNQLLCGAYCC